MAGPPEFWGFAGILHIDSAAAREVAFEGVRIGASCEPANSMDVTDGVAVVEGDGEAILFDLVGRPRHVALPETYVDFVRFDEGYLYFLDVSDGVLRRINVLNGSQEAVLSGVSYLVDLEVAQGLVFGLTLGEDSGERGPRLSAFDVGRRRFVLQEAYLPSPWAVGRTGPPRIIGVDGSRAIFLSEGERVLAYDVVTLNETQLARLPHGFIWKVAYGDGAVAYEADGHLFFMDLIEGSSRMVRAAFRGDNLALDSGFVGYNYYVTTPPTEPAVPAAAAVSALEIGAVVGMVAVLSWLRYRRKS